MNAYRHIGVNTSLVDEGLRFDTIASSQPVQQLSLGVAASVDGSAVERCEGFSYGQQYTNLLLDLTLDTIKPPKNILVQATGRSWGAD